MAEEDKKAPTELEKPAGAPKTPKEELQIHVIPEEFYGAALKKKVKKEPPKPPPVPVAVPSAPGGPQPPKTPAPPPKKGSKLPIIIGVVVLLLIVAAVAGYFLLFREQKPPAPVCGNNACELPAETSATCPSDCGPPPPVCGDGECSSKESPYSCEEDCGPPPPVCGDTECEEPESPETCPVDCGPPPAECGNNKCEEGEDYKSCSEDCEPPEPTASADTDSDGLTDSEEKGIYNTSINDPNSDGDSYVDLNEVLNLFDPATPAPSALIDNPGITLYRNVGFGLDIYRPTAWKVRDDLEARQVFFTAPAGEIIQIIVQDKPGDQTLVEWYLAQSPGVRQSQVEVLKTRKGYDQVISPDRMTIYVEAGGKVYVLTYSLGDELEIRYRVTLTMMVSSLQALESEEGPTGEEGPGEGE